MRHSNKEEEGRQKEGKGKGGACPTKEKIIPC